MESGRGCIGGYRVERVLGRGSTSTVYEAVAPGGGATIALKAVSRCCVDAFERERTALRTLAGTPGVVDLVDHGIDADAGRYLVLDRVAGDPLQARLRRGGPIPPATVERVAAALVHGLGAVHAAGFVHGDVKPANVLLGAGDAPVLIDFGCARAAPPRANRSRSRPAHRAVTVTGTVAHLAPEVLAGAPPTPASDRYGLGSTLWTLLTGDPPFGDGEGEDERALAQRIIDQPLANPAERGVPPAWRGWLARLLDKRADRRSMRWPPGLSR